MLDLARIETGDFERVFFIYRDGETIGPYTAEEVRRRIAQGAIGTDDFCWREGMTDWQVIAETPVFGDRPAARPLRRKPTAPVPLKPAKRQPEASPPAVAPELKPEGNLWPKLLMLAGAILALYCIAFYPKLQIDPREQRGLEMLLGQSVQSTRTQDRALGMAAGVLLLASGGIFFYRSVRRSIDSD
ncbi:MAG: DUF4339 domain-containing protein [Chthoniobacterales bacterium]